MPMYLKRGATAEAKADRDRSVRDTVEEILADVEARGDDAVRELSIRFDRWDRESYRLTAAEIQDCMDQLSGQDLKDIEFAQRQVRNFAQIQRASLQDVEVETLPGVILGHRNIPLRRVAGEHDIVARIGGDEFVVIVVDDDGARAQKVADAAVAALAEPYAIDRFVAHAGASIGVVLSPGDGTTVEALRQAADLALYRAKASGRGHVRFFSVAMDAEAAERRTLECDLRTALDAGAIDIAYQPIVACATGQVTSFEALARWTHPTRGAIPPKTFIGIAEESGLIGLLGDTVLREACHAAAAWPEAIRIAVNLSPLQFENNDLVATVRCALATSGLSPHRLQLEVTESLVIRDVDNTFRILTELRALGVQILLDDFGVGYSSLSYFERFPFDKVKIDRSFVEKMATTPAACAIVQAVVGLGQTLGMGIVAEGVETPEQMHALIEIGCTHLQGFLFSRPMPEAAFAHILSAPAHQSPRAQGQRA